MMDRSINGLTGLTKFEKSLLVTEAEAAPIHMFVRTQDILSSNEQRSAMVVYP